VLVAGIIAYGIYRYMNPESSETIIKSSTKKVSVVQPPQIYPRVRPERFQLERPSRHIFFPEPKPTYQKFFDMVQNISVSLKPNFQPRTRFNQLQALFSKNYPHTLDLPQSSSNN
jgi:hypothetical protein